VNEREQIDDSKFRIDAKMNPKENIHKRKDFINDYSNLVNEKNNIKFAKTETS